MKNKLKKYSDFIKESVQVFDLDKNLIVITESDVKKMIDDNNSKDINELRDTFTEDIDELTSDEYTGYFSDLCKRANANPEHDYKNMQSELETKKGWSFEMIKLIFSEEANKIVGKDFFEWYKSTRLDSKNGYCDIYLYFTADKLGLDKNQIALGGDGWANFDEDDEIIIRYKYGYHQTPYGQLYINEIPGLMEKYYEVALTYLQDDLKENWSEIITKNLTDNPTTANYNKVVQSYIEQFVTINEFSVVEEDRLIIFCQGIADKINSKFGTKITGEEISSRFIAYLKWIPTETQYIDGDLIIWSQFDINK